MGQLKHLLGGLACRYFGRTPRRPRLGTPPLSRKAQERRRRHLTRCAECRVRQQRERQYLERLRGAAVPAASDDLTARLLARTGELAVGPEDAGKTHSALPDAAPAAVTGPGAVPGLQRAPQARRARPWRLAAQIAGGIAATTALMGGAAYLIGSDAPLTADGAFAAALPGRLPGPAVTSESVSGAAWKLSSGPDVAPAGGLNTEQLAALRARGWTCPELRELGYHLLWARGGVADGSEVLELRLTDGLHFATVLEQHPKAFPDGPGGAGSGQLPTAPPVNVLTGHPATEDGFVAVRRAEAAAPENPVPAEGTLWVNRQAPFRAIYRTPVATFTYVSELPEEQADDGVGALVQSRPGGAAAAASGEGIEARLERGMERIMELLVR